MGTLLNGLGMPSTRRNKEGGGGGAVLPETDLFFGVLAGLENNYQDSAGTTPAAADSVIGAAGGYGSSGWDNVIQATTANKPILRNDGTRYYLEFDSINDQLANTATQTPTLGGPFSYTTAVKVDFTLGARTTLDLFGFTGNSSCRLKFKDTTEEVWAGGPGGNTSVPSGVDTGDIFIVTVQRGTAASSTAIKIRVNGVELRNDTSSVAITGRNNFILGASLSGANPFGSEVYGFLFYEGDGTDEQFAEREQFFNDQYSLGVL